MLVKVWEWTIIITIVTCFMKGFIESVCIQIIIYNKTYNIYSINNPIKIYLQTKINVLRIEKKHYMLTLLT